MKKHKLAHYLMSMYNGNIDEGTFRNLKLICMHCANTPGVIDLCAHRIAALLGTKEVNTIKNHISDFYYDENY